MLNASPDSGSRQHLSMDAYGLDHQAWRRWAQAHSLPAYRGQQVFEAIMHRGATRFAAVKGLPAGLQQEWDQQFRWLDGQEIRQQRSCDGTCKSLLQLHDGSLAECVGIPTNDRQTVCVSSQVGCAVGCTFCASGLHGVTRDLTAGEIVAQVLHFHRWRPVSNVVFMGSGEPLFNYQAVLQAIRVLGDERGLNLGRRRITVSTSGVAPKIRCFGQDEPQVTLALSLHAPDDETRNRLVPLNRRWPIAELLDAMDAYAKTVNRRMTFEYVLLADANMASAQARDLARLARRYGAHINLIPFNTVEHSQHRAPAEAEVQRFAAELGRAGGHYTLRGQRGADIDAACGQLADKNRR